MSIEDCHILNLPKKTDLRGSLTFVEGGVHVPFEIQRIYYLYEVPRDAGRGAHAHRQLQQLLVAMNGSFDVLLGDGANQRRFHLCSPSQGLYVGPMIWRDIENFSEGAVCLVLASRRYEESDYFRSYEDYLAALKES